MRKFFSRAFLVAGMLALAACGGGDSGSQFESPGTGGGGSTPPPSGPVAASINVLASSTTLQSAGAGATVDISAFVTDANNAVIEGATVVFAADSGQLQVTQAATDASGLATATLSAGNDPSNRRINVTATSGAASGSVGIDVTGTQINLQGPGTLTLSQSGNYTVRLVDAAGAAVGNRTVTVASARNNALSATSLTTDASGSASFTLTVNNTGADTLTATALGATGTLNVNVNSDSFTFMSPAANTEIPLNTAQPITLRWQASGAPVVGATVTLASTRGAVSTSSAVTNGAGEISFTISSTSSGLAVVTAAGTGAIAQLPLEFVATAPATIEVQPSLFSLAPSQESTLTATVRDANGNLVKNQTVTFALQDITGGTLSTASAVTDSQGRAQSTYKAGLTTSASGGVVVTAAVQGTAITDSVNLTVAQAQLFISLGTGNTLETPNSAQYAIPYAVQVTDANGNGVANVPLSLRVLSTFYRKGVRADAVPFPVQISGQCEDEDENNNGVLDLDLLEDDNGSGRIEAGNIATVTPSGVTTDANGFAQIKVVYPREYAYWLFVRLDVTAGVAGTEFIRSANILLPGTTDDFDGPGAPPGPVSPFGVNTCGDPD